MLGHNQTSPAYCQWALHTEKPTARRKNEQKKETLVDKTPPPGFYKYDRHNPVPSTISPPPLADAAMDNPRLSSASSSLGSGIVAFVRRWVGDLSLRVFVVGLGICFLCAEGICSSLVYEEEIAAAAMMIRVFSHAPL